METALEKELGLPHNQSAPLMDPVKEEPDVMEEPDVVMEEPDVMEIE